VVWVQQLPRFTSHPSKRLSNIGCIVFDRTVEKYNKLPNLPPTTHTQELHISLSSGQPFVTFDVSGWVGVGFVVWRIEGKKKEKKRKKEEKTRE